MKIGNVIVAGLSALALAGCVSNASQTAAVQEPAPARAGNIAQRAGLDAAAATKEAGRKGFDGFVDAGVGASMAHDFGGPGIGLGILGWLAGSSSTGWSEPTMLAELPAGSDRARYEALYSEALFNAVGKNHGGEGYTRVSDPYDSSFVTFIKPGCQITRQGYYERSCSKRYGVKLAAAKGSGVYVLQVFTTDSLGQLEPIYRKIVSQRSQELALYLPPRKVGGQVMPARLIEKGKETSL